jgi:hypothetical protein
MWALTLVGQCVFDNHCAVAASWRVSKSLGIWAKFLSKPVPYQYSRYILSLCLNHSNVCRALLVNVGKRSIEKLSKPVSKALFTGVFGERV